MDHMSNTDQMPPEEGIDHSLSLMREGYMLHFEQTSQF